VIADALFDSLTAYSADGSPRPAAAVRWAADETASIWTFSLREGATYADDGDTPVTAADFVFSWTRAAMSGRAGYHLNDVEGYDELAAGSTTTFRGLTALNDTTLEVRLRAPFADFPSVVAHPALGPLPRSRFEADAEAFARQPVGNGPFVAETWEPGGFLRAVRAEGWRNGPRPPLDEVVFQFSDAETAFVAFQQGRRDYAPLPVGALAPARERYGEALDGYRGSGVIDGPSPQLYFLGVDLDTPPLDRVEVRRALSLALDRDAIAAAVREGNADPALGAVPRAVPHARDRPCDYCRYDPAAAAQLFAEAGVTELELWFNRDGGHQQIAELIAEQLDAVGVTLRPRSAPAPPPGTPPLESYLEVLRTGRAALFRFGWTTEHPLLDDALRPLFSAELAGDPGGANYGGYANPQVDSLLAQARATRDLQQRLRLYERAEDLAIDRDQAIVPLLTFRHAAVVSDRFSGFALDPMGLPNLAEVRLAPTG
jgi:ABC-type transport system substrate-binding protein